LTNDSAYWKAPSYSNTVDADFRLHEGRTLSGRLVWSEHAGKGTTKNREAALYLRGSYEMRWADYSTPGGDPYGHFKYLLVKVAPEPVIL
jgi:hypothetical protein